MSISISGNGTFTGVSTSYSFDQSVSIGGTLTYEDVTNIDSVGLITARQGVHYGDVGSGVTITAVGAGTSLGFLVNNSERLRIDSSGRLLLGTTTDISGGSTNTSIQVVGDTNNTTGEIYLGRNDTGVLVDNEIGKIEWRNNDSDGTTWEAVARISAEAEAAYNTGDKPGRLVFSTTADSESSPTERMRISADGTTRFTTGAVFLEAVSNTDNTQISLGRPNSTSAGYIRYLNSDDALAFRTGGSGEDVRIDSDGRLLVGINTGIIPSIHAKIQAVSTGGAYLVLARNDTSVTNNNIGLISFYGNDDDGNYEECALIACVADGTHATGDKPSYLSFHTTADGESSPTERTRITSGGQVIFGAVDLNDPTMYFNPDSGGGYFIKDTNSTNARTAFEFRNPNGTVGSIVTSASATAYNETSDYRLKENVVPLTGAIDRLNQLQVRRFNFIADPDTTVDGFLAHEAQEVVPESVTGEKDAVDENGNPEYQGIDKSKLVPLLTAALKEAIAKIETLEQRLADAGIA